MILPGTDKPAGAAGVAALGHRAYVGGRWNEIGRLTFGFLRRRGLEREDVLLDIGCGSLRVGVHLIAWLDPGHYLGIDAEDALIRAGIRDELDPTVYATRRPEFVVSADFAFDRFTRQPDVALAQSLFTHLAPVDIDRCLDRLARTMAPGGVLYATYFRGPAACEVPTGPSHPHRRFVYPAAFMAERAAALGWSVEQIGPWGHPRGQEMLCFRRR